MPYNEYMPRGGWIKYRKRQRMKSAVYGGAVIFAYCIASTLIYFTE